MPIVSVLKSLRMDFRRRGWPAVSRFRRTVSTKLKDATTISERRDLTRFETLHELQTSSATAFATNDLFGTFDPETKDFKYLSYHEFDNLVSRCRVLLNDLGVKQFDKVGIISNNRWEWAVIASAVYSLNGTLVPMYEAQITSDWTYILNDSGVSVLFCATDEIFAKVQKEVLPSTQSVHSCLSLGAEIGDPHSFKTALNSDCHGKHGLFDHNRIYPPAADDLANLIYTSGTTGKPKGVELTHQNIISNVKAAREKILENPSDVIGAKDRSLAFLPWAHSYGQTCELWMGMSMGASIGICRGVPSILEDLQLVRPTVLFSVPTLYKKVHDGVHNLIGSSSPMFASLLRFGLHVGGEHAAMLRGKRKAFSPVESMKFQLMDRLILSRIRGRFGGNLRYGCVAGAACPREVLDFMDSIGIPVCEGYGLTETSPIITINVPSDRLNGSVGRPIGGVDVFIIDEEGNLLPPGAEGEICCSGPNVMKGYHNNKAATDEVISVAPDGKSKMFHTGDLGRMDEDGWLRVTGRLKEQYKLENGKYVVPTPIEVAIGMSRFISQVVLCGANRPYNTALIVPEWPAIRAELDVGDEVSDEELANDERVKALIDGDVSTNCTELKKFEIPSKWAFVAPFTAANNMLTPKMSIRRHKVIEAYADLISGMYGDDLAVTNAVDSDVDAA